LRSIGMENGSIATEETQVAWYAFSGTRRTRSGAALPGAGDLERERGGGFDAFAGQIVGGGEAPAAPHQHTNAQPGGFAAGYVAHLAVLGGDLALARFHGAHIGVVHAASGDGIECAKGQVFHRGVISPPSLSCSLEAARGKRVE